MAIISGVTVNWKASPRIITIPDPITEVTIVDLQDTLLNIEDTEEGVVFPRLRDTSGGEALGGGVTVGWTLQLNNAQLQFEGRTAIFDSGSATSPDTKGQTLIDTGATFVTTGVARGMTVFNSTTGAMAAIVSVDSETQLTCQTLSGGSRATWLATDAYAIYKNEQCLVTGGNLVAVNDVGASIEPMFQAPNTNVVRTSSSSATNQNAEDIEYAAFEGGITIDSIAGTSTGTGKRSDPVDTLAAAIPLAEARGFSKLYFDEDYTFQNGDSVDEYDLIGRGKGRTKLTFVATTSTSNTFIKACEVTGVADGAISFFDCLLKDISGVGCTTNDMTWENCQFEGTIGVRADNNVPIHIVNCRSGIAGLDTPILDYNGSEGPIDVRNYIGGLEIIDCTNALTACSIDLEGHIVIQNATNTAGTFVVRGRGKKTITATGPTIDSDNFLQTSQLEALVQRNAYTGKGGVGVTIAPTTGTDSIAYPYGTPQDPVKTEQNLFDFDSQVFFYRNIYVDESLTLTQDHSGDAHNWYGKDPASTVITLQAGCDLSGAQFFDANVTGQVTNLGSGFTILRECIVGGLSNFNGFLYKCSLYGTISPNGSLNIEDCFISSSQPDQTLTIDFQGQAITIIVGDWSAGRLKPINMATGSFFGASGTGGRVITDASNTGGTIVYAGALGIDDTHAANLDALNDSTVANATWTKAVEGTFTAAEVMKIMSSALAGKLTGAGTSTIAIRDLNDTTDRVNATVDENGNRTAVSHNVS